MDDGCSVEQQPGYRPQMGDQLEFLSGSLTGRVLTCFRLSDDGKTATYQDDTGEVYAFTVPMPEPTNDP